MRRRVHGSSFLPSLAGEGWHDLTEPLFGGLSQAEGPLAWPPEGSYGSHVPAGCSEGEMRTLKRKHWLMAVAVSLFAFAPAPAVSVASGLDAGIGNVPQGGQSDS